MMFSEAKAARDRLEDTLTCEGWPTVSVDRADLVAVCAWTHHWEDTADEIGAIADERDSLFRWKGEASVVMEDLHQAWVSAGRPGPLGMSMARAMAHEIEQLRLALNDAVARSREARG